ncbi:Uncharacterized conserved protein YloU, alkaline shock protein (Asp23) family [Microlunatus sagamiharensis]|uniref:Uncharacterized conserved protein YloU, alkaline shock protein (Asp23) family n=1 Tax=Microlunatus sagamiharensis TaxID=546874 RepID=A0A1H2MA57_9ACTN|nr:Asp23/Gls24 family envelope stress response protein [Microlunatus sagamiharensis]SDU89821.1 Uncharacterized conserved protein YloU, alkaline shock protein (Asp23) family [Microlunatus sagamiharensis]
MSTPDAPRSGAPGTDPSPRRRGSLVLADRVVEKIAAQAASEVGSVSGCSGGFLGIGSESDAAARPSVDATVSARSVDLSIKVGIAYPGSIRRATTELRDHVTRRVETLTGVDVHRVDIDVTYLPVRDDTPRRALR